MFGVYKSEVRKLMFFKKPSELFTVNDINTVKKRVCLGFSRSRIIILRKCSEICRSENTLTRVGNTHRISDWFLREKVQKIVKSIAFEMLNLIRINN